MTLVRNPSVKASRRSRRSASLAALLLTGTAITCVPTLAQAQSKWNGTNSADWHDAANWTPNAVPDANTDATIDTTAPNAATLDSGTAAMHTLTVGDIATGKFTIGNAAGLNGYDVFVGENQGSNGSVTVTDMGSTLSLTNFLEVGVGGSGTMTISDGAVVADVNGFVGGVGVDTGVGTVTVTGAKASWQNSDGLIVGASGQGTLHIMNGGSVSAPGSIIGNSAGATGTVTVDGAGSSFIASTNADPTVDRMYVGYAGTGTVQITAAGSVQAFDAYLGYDSVDAAHQAQGSITIDGSGSVLTIQHGLYVGGNHSTVAALGASSGMLSISGGGLLSSMGDFIVGSSDQATGTVTVTGPGSTLTQNGDLWIGDYDGTGTVNILAKGQGSAGNVVLALTGKSMGTLLVDGAQSKLTADELIVGDEGTGTATVSGGGELDAVGLIVASVSGTTGTVKVTDAGSSLNLSDDATIGDGGTGKLSILAGATMGDQNAFIGSDGGPGTVTVDGPGSTWTTNAALSVGAASSGTLTIRNGGKATSGHAEIGAGPQGDGTVDVTDAGSTWATTDLIDAYSGKGMMTVEKGGTVTASTVDVGLAAQSTGTLSVTGAGSSLTSTGLLYVGVNGTGTITIDAGASVGTDVGEIGVQATGIGTVTVDGAGSSWKSNNLTVGDSGTGTLTIRNGASATGSGSAVGYQANSSGTIDLDGAGSSLTVGSIVLAGYGTGTLTVSNGATFDDLPGMTLAQNSGSVGTLNIGADAASAAAGAGGVDISVIGFGAGTGTITFNHTDQDYQFTPAMSGVGTINQIAGVTHLISDSSGFSGTTNVVGGTLFVDNNLNFIAGTVNVDSGGTLGGIGKTGGAVNVHDGATLLGVQGQTFTMGSLTLASGALVDVTLDTPSGAALFKVTGDLVLDGTLNVSAPGAFGPGVYALMTYGGTLTDQDLVIGTTPTGTAAADFSIQTSVAGQVNLVDAKPLDHVFWDGDAAGSANNGVVDGGSGVWSETNANWTDVSGGSNGAMTPQPGFAIFENKSGIVTVDGSAGPIAVTGMQFASNGYIVVGDAITLADPNSQIRVGNGSAAGAGYVATIEAALTGAGGLNKTDLGTLVLGGTNSYTGGTTITAGTLQIGDGTAGGYASVVGDIVNNARLVFDNQASPVETSNAISGSGSVRISGTTIYTGTGTYTGGTAIDADGLLYIGSNGTIGSIVGAVANSGELVLNRSDDFGFAGTISGVGLVFQNGSGRTILTGVNDYTGETRIADGTIALAGNGSIAASSKVDVGTSGTFDISAANGGASIVTLGGTGAVRLGAQTLILTNANDQFDGVIAGTGGLTVAKGVETLTGANTYTGGTVIGANARLDLEDAGSIIGNVQDDGILAFEDSVDQTFDGVISGAGGVVTDGNHITTLTGVNGYAGGTLIGQGTLVGSATSFGTGPIDDEGALVIDQPGDAAFANALGGTGSFTKQGAGALDYTGDGSSFTGSTNVTAGRLAVNGSLTGSVVTVASGATLGGNGVVGGVVAQSGAIVAPGNSIGTLHVAGNYSQAAGATYQVQLTSTGMADRIDVTGTATIAPGAIMGITKTDAAPYVPGTHYTVLTAGGGVSGSFTLTGNTQLSNFLGLVLSYAPQSVFLDVAQIKSFASAGSTHNQVATGGGLDSLPSSNPIVGAVVMMPDDARAAAAFDQLSGEIHASAKTAMLEDSRLIRDLAIGHLMSRQDQGAGTGIWGQGVGAWASNDGDGNAARMTRSNGGLALGVDIAPIDGLRLGLLGSYTRGSLAIPARASSAKIASYSLGGYGGASMGPVQFRFGGSYAWNRLRTTRGVGFAGFSDHLTARYDGSTAQAFADIGYRIGTARSHVEPFAQAAWIDVATDGFTERGGAAALTGARRSQSIALTTLGLRGATAFSIGVPVSVHATAGWRHAGGDRAPTASLAFAGGDPFVIAGVPIARNSATLDAGIDFDLAPAVRLTISYAGQIAAHAQDNGVKAGIDWRF